MNRFNSERSEDWNVHPSSDSSPSQTEVSHEGPWKNFGTSMNALSFGFVATAILISMFLIMAIFEHLFKPSESSASPQDDSNRTSQSTQPQKLRDSKGVSTTSYSSDFSVLMPGQKYPTFIAQPAPLPCQREGVLWPPHEHI